MSKRQYLGLLLAAFIGGAVANLTLGGISAAAYANAPESMKIDGEVKVRIVGPLYSGKDNQNEKFKRSLLIYNSQ